MKRRVIVIGGGPAGMMAAIAAAENGCSALLIEANEKLGKKLYITGKGRCNLTNGCEREEFFKNIPRNPRFLMSGFSRLDNHALMQRFEDWGVPLVVERGERVFPASGKASDITRALSQQLVALGVEVRVNTRCTGLNIENGAVCAVRTGRGTFPCDAAIIATGGVSYPLTGSTGDGYSFAEEAGHQVIPPRGSLVPLETEDEWKRPLQGLSLKNVELCARKGKKLLYRERGEMMFTHFGITGPLVLSLSAHLPEDLDGVEVWIDLKPALTEEQVAARLLREIEGAQRRRLSTILCELMPRSFAEVFGSIAGMDGATEGHQITREQRAALARIVKHVPLRVSGPRPVAEAVVTRGGVDVRGVEPATMRSKMVKGLHFAGEVLDVDAYTGGFNLQIAFTTGYAAGVAAARTEEETP